MSCGFIFPRHVKTISQNNIWWTCVRQIRKYYPDIEIVIIDDHSDRTNLMNPPEGLDARITVIYSDYPKNCGELLPYLYFYERKFFNKACILNDSMFLQQRINFDAVATVQFLWHFKRSEILNEPSLFGLTTHLKHGQKVWRILNNADLCPFGMFASASVMTWSVVKQLQEDFDLQSLSRWVTTRRHRMAMERILAALCFISYPDLVKQLSLVGDIHTMPKAFQFSLIDYQSNQYELSKFPLVKVWNGR